MSDVEVAEEACNNCQGQLTRNNGYEHFTCENCGRAVAPEFVT